MSAATAAQLDVELVGLDDLFARADYVSLHMPSTDRTRRMVNAALLASQFAALEAPETSEGVLTVEVAQKPQQIVEAITRQLTG